MIQIWYNHAIKKKIKNWYNHNSQLGWLYNLLRSRRWPSWTRRGPVGVRSQSRKYWAFEDQDHGTPGLVNAQILWWPKIRSKHSPTTSKAVTKTVHRALKRKSNWHVKHSPFFLNFACDLNRVSFFLCFFSLIFEPFKMAKYHLWMKYLVIYHCLWNI